MPTKTRSKSRTLARTKTKVILASAAIIAAAAAGAYQVDRASYTRQTVEPVNIVRYAEEGTVDYQGSGAARDAVVTFVTTQDITPQTTMLMTFHEGMETSTSVTTVQMEGGLTNGFAIIPSGRSISLAYNGIHTIPAGASFQVEVENILVGSSRPLDGGMDVAVVQVASEEVAEEEEDVPAEDMSDTEDEEALELLAPKGGEVFSAADTYTVRWTPLSSALVYTVSFTDGATRMYRELGETKDAYFEMEMPDVITDLARISVYAESEDGTEVGEVFSNTFVLTEPVDKRAGESEDEHVVKEDADQRRTDDEEEEVEVVEAEASPTSGSGRSNRQPHDLDNDDTTPSNVVPPTPTPSVAGYNNLIKMECPAQASLELNHPCRTVYYHSTLGTRHPFPNEKVFFTWYNSFQNINVLSRDAMAAIPLGKNVTYRPGSTMVKFQSLNTVYTVTRGGVLRAVDSEEVAQGLYGEDWNQYIHDISDVFFPNYEFGAAIVMPEEFNIAGTYGSVSTITDNF